MARYDREDPNRTVRPFDAQVVTISSNGLCSALPSNITPSCAIRVWFIGTPLG
jgi:hypothetical protein